MKGFRAPSEPEAADRTWEVVAAAFAERTPQPARRALPLRPLLALAAAAAVTAVAFTSPGHAVLATVRQAIGVEHATRALYSLPAPGRLLAGRWLVEADGSTRRLGDYRQTAWSPFGRFVVATRRDALVALTPDGTVRWTLARPDVRFPRWAGTRTDTRIAYLSGRRLRVVAGDGTDDHAAGPSAAAAVAPAWRPGTPFVLAYADRLGRVWAFEPDSGRLLFRTPAGPPPAALAWSGDGSRLLVAGPGGVRVLDLHGRVRARAGGPALDAAFLPGSRRVVVLRSGRGQSEVELLGPRRILFRTSGLLRQVVPSPNGRWLLLTWPGADQWLFVPTGGGRRLSAVGNIAEQLGGGGFPVGGWTS